MISLAKLSVRSRWAGAWIVVGIVLSVRAFLCVMYAVCSTGCTYLRERRVGDEQSFRQR